MSKFLKNNAHLVFVVLGHACNNRCIYCMQHDIVTNQINKEMNPDVIKFLDELGSDRGEESPLRVHFFGGEPLIYFEALERIVKELTKSKNQFQFSLISNGKALTDKMVRFFNTYDVSFILSWDGDNVMKTRKCDVLNDLALRKRFLALKKFGIVGVACSYCYPLDFMKACIPFAEEYYQRHGNYMGAFMDQIYDSDIADRSLFDIDYEKMYSQMKMLADCYFHPDQYEDPVLKHRLSRDFIDYIMNQIKFHVDSNGNKHNCNMCVCGNGYSTYNIDLKGNLYFCHNMDTPCSTIYDPYLKYLNGILELDTTRANKSVCSECPVYSVCRGGCPMIPKQVREETYCALKKAFFYPVVESLLSLE